MRSSSQSEARGQKKAVSFGGWLNIGHPALAELMASCGFEWLAVDLEHGSVDISDCLNLVQAIRGQGVTPMARLPYKDTIWIRRVLDAGFMGLIVPMIDTAEEASDVVSAAKYPPEGKRGIGFAAANMYGIRMNEYMTTANKDIKVICQVETTAGVENVDEILSVRGVDGVFMGPYDLSGSYGVLGQFDHPLMVSAYETVLSACAKRSKLAGIHVVQPDPDEVARRLRQGFDFIALSLDVTMLAESCSTLLAAAAKALSAMDGADTK